MDRVNCSTVIGNSWHAAASSSVHIGGCSRLTFSGNAIHDAGSHGIYYIPTSNGSTSVTISGNTIVDSAGAGIYAITSSGSIDGLSVSSNQFRDNNLGEIILYQANPNAFKNVCITGNCLSHLTGAAGTNCIYISSASDTSAVLIASNQVTQVVAAPAIELVGTNISSLSILSNNINGGTYSISESVTASMTNCTAAGNYCSGFTASPGDPIQTAGSGGAGTSFLHAAESTSSADLPNLY
jgi:hypothetical protein